jgi:DNA invertase Pin-like site-specific DNA recombinase
VLYLHLFFELLDFALDPLIFQRLDRGKVVTVLGFKTSSGITDRHLKLQIIIYIRQSSDRQVQDQHWSAAAQRRLIKVVLKLGWRREQIVVIDEDQGRSAAGGEHRSGFQRVLRMVMNGGVGAIALLIESRIGRDDADWAYLLKQCRRWGVLFIVNNTVEDPREKRGWLGLKVKGLVSEIENQDRSTMVTEAMKAKVAAGEMATTVPPGYVINRSGRVVKDRDPQIRAFIEALFRIFDEKGSCGRTVEQMKKEGILIPTLLHRKRGRTRKTIEPAQK